MLEKEKKFVINDIFKAEEVGLEKTTKDNNKASCL